MLKFEHLFGPRVTKNTYSQRLQKIFSHFGLEPIKGSSLWWTLRDQKAAAKNKAGLKLTAAERQTVKRICGSVMERLEYA